MKKPIPVKGLKIFLLLFQFILIVSLQNPCAAQVKTDNSSYPVLIQQADKAMAAKDYANAILLYEKAGRAKPELLYAAGKISEINTLLDADPNTRSKIFEDIILNAESLFKQKKYPEAKTEYHKAILIDPTLQFPQDRLVQISDLYTDPDDLIYFNNAVADGDKALSVNDFDKATSFYEKALTIKPNTKTVLDKITRTKKLKSDFKLKSDSYAKSIASADKLFAAGKRTEARVEYQKAAEFLPENQYPKQRIQEIDTYASNLKANQEKYDKSVELADQFYINRDFASARLKYQEALSVKPEARYPKEMLEKTSSGESQLQSDQEKYNAVLASAEGLLKSTDYEAALAGFKSASALKPSENYPKSKIVEIEKLISDQAARKTSFDLAIKKGDLLLNEKKYDDAVNSYRNALVLYPDDKYALGKIEEITAITLQLKVLDDNYNKSLAEADKLFSAGKFDEAIIGYNKCLGYKPDEIYPLQQLTQAKDKLAAARSKEENYASAISTGDKLTSDFKYEEALTAYKQALTLKPAEKYPKDKTDEINKILAKQKTDSELYSVSVTQGDKAFASGNYEVALKSFQDASKIKPSEQYPNNRISEINTLVAARQKNDLQYTTAITTGNQLLTAKNYEAARAAFSEAASLKKDEKLPQDQIAKIDRILSDLRSADENYSKALAEGDKQLANLNYTMAITAYKQASVIKATETYPKLQLEKINQRLAEIKKLETDYTAAIALADKSFNAGNFPDAISGYRKALELKPVEKYPSDKITEAEKQIDEDKSRKEMYAKAITDGERLLKDKDYSNALISFKTASTANPAEAYPTQKINEIQTILDREKAASSKYLETITQADNFFNDQKYSEAFDSYQRASAIKPEEQYPLTQTQKINELIARQKKLAADYQKLITDADALNKSGNYTEARSLYANALILKPSEKFPKDKIAEIDGQLAGIQKKEQNYAKAISDADAFFTDKKYTEATVSYNAAVALKPAESYPKSQLSKINALIAEQKKLDDGFLAAVTKADQLFDAKKYIEAINEYRKALDLKPLETYPADKIKESEKQLADIKTTQETYDKAIAEGNKKLELKDYENALVNFKTAISAKPNEPFANQKIAEIQSIINKNLAENERYSATLAVADKFFAAEKYREALEPYQTAVTIKPTEKYPQEQIVRINLKLNELKKAEDEYQKLISDAGAQLAERKFDQARLTYTKAGTIQPSEKLPKEKVAEIDGILAGLKIKEENYTKALTTADQLYTSKDFDGAIKTYQEATAIKPSERFPVERISAIQAEIKAKTDNYLKAVSLGDTKLAAKDLMEALNAYQNALEIKPNEAYPKSKIAEINSALSAQKEELEKMYATYITEGDQLAASKEYIAATSAFTKAAGIKPAETYPRQRIAEISKITEEIALAQKAEYTKALGEADKLYNSKIYDLAIEAYEKASAINTSDAYPVQQISKIRKYMSDHAINDLLTQTLAISAGNEKKFNFSAIEPRLRKNNYILLKARTTGKATPKVYLNYGKDSQKNGGIVIHSIDKNTTNDYLIRISVQDKWYREDNNWISLFVETGDIEVTKIQIAAGE